MKISFIPLFLLLCLFLALAGGCTNEGGEPYKLPDMQSVETPETSPNENGKIKSGEIVLCPEKDRLNHAYDHIRVEIVNNSSHSFSWFNEYDLFEKMEGDFVPVDDNGDDFTEKRAEDAVIKVVPSGETISARLYLGQLIDDGYTRPGVYKLQLPINEDVRAETTFEITDQYIPMDTGLSIGMESDVVDGDNEEPFWYFVHNDTEETIQVTLDVHIAHYESGKWVRLSPSQEYLEAHYNASLWSENCSPHTEWKGQFRLSLFDMIDTELAPGQYRLEKQILSEWYFFEFEVV